MDFSSLFIERLRPELLLAKLNGDSDFGMAGLRKANAEAAEARCIFLKELRSLVDRWIESGRAADGREFPRERRAERKPWIVDGGVEIEGETPSVFDQVDQWLINNPPSASLLPTGELELSLRQWRRAGPVALSEAALSEARLLFVLLMHSAAKYALFKCTHPGCGTYYILEKPRRQYMDGTVCPDHRRQQGMRRKRKLERAEALEVAAEALATWPRLSASTRAKHTSEKHYIASKLKRFGVGAKWVTRNLTKIMESEAK